MKDVYIAIDLKSFYASVECQIRGLNPLTANLVVADESRTAKTICLAVSPALKAYGIPGRARLFEVEQKIKQVNRQRQSKILGHKLVGESVEYTELKANPQMAVAYVVAKPRPSGTVPMVLPALTWSPTLTVGVKSQSRLGMASR